MVYSFIIISSKDNNTNNNSFKLELIDFKKNIKEVCSSSYTYDLFRI